MRALSAVDAIPAARRVRESVDGSQVRIAAVGGLIACGLLVGGAGGLGVAVATASPGQQGGNGHDGTGQRGPKKDAGDRGTQGPGSTSGSKGQGGQGNQGKDNVSKDWFPADGLHLRRAPAPAEGSTGTNAADRPRTGGYSTELFIPRETQKMPIGLGLLDRGDLDRSSLDRGALNDNTKIDASGSVKVQVGGKTSSEKQGIKHLFKESSMENMEQMPQTPAGPSVDETAKQYMANR